MLAVEAEAFGRALGKKDLEDGLEEVGVEVKRDVDEAKGSLLLGVSVT